MSAATDLAHAINSAAARHATRGRVVATGEVLKTAPLKVELHDSRHVLDDDDFDLSAWVDFYDDEWGLKAGDTVLMMRDEDADWLIFDVLGDVTAKIGEAKPLTKLKERMERAEERLERHADRLSALEERVTALETPDA